jgi:hypothetical protein
VFSYFNVIILAGLGKQWFCGKMSREQCEDQFGKVIISNQSVQ